jgi:hypothetical protein
LLRPAAGGEYEWELQRKTRLVAELEKLRMVNGVLSEHQNVFYRA